MDGNPLAIQAPFGQETTFSLDGNGYLETVTHAGGSTSLTHSSGGLLSAMVDARNNPYAFSYSSSGRLEFYSDPAGGSKTLTRSFLGGPYEVTLTTGEGRERTYRVEKSASGEKRRLNTSAAGLQSESLLEPDATRSATRPDGTTIGVQQGPDPRFNMQQPLASRTFRNPSGLTLAASTARGVTLANPANPFSLTTMTDTITVNGRPFTSAFDAATLTFTDTSPVGRQSIRQIDAQGRITQAQVGTLLPVVRTYDTHGRLATITQGNGSYTRTTTFAYNVAGFLDTTADALNRPTRFEYDGVGHVTKQILPDARELIFAYDANGNLISITPPGRPALPSPTPL